MVILIPISISIIIGVIIWKKYVSKNKEIKSMMRFDEINTDHDLSEKIDKVDTVKNKEDKIKINKFNEEK